MTTLQRNALKPTPVAKIPHLATPLLTSRGFSCFSLLFSLVFISNSFGAETLPSTDQRAHSPTTLNTLRDFPSIKSKSEWESRAREIRENVLVSCGLWPMPEKTPLQAHVFGKIDRGDYTIEKVYFQTYPGFYLAGNLYRPAGKGNGPFPAVLNPHGHWNNGRMANSTNGSIAARCINFAKHGMIAFSYDMVGYNDTIQVSHEFGKDPANQLWNISLMGLQTWNSIRALDFLSSLPDVDQKRLACTGESGGGTQTFMLGAVENRLALQAPIVMVSHSMQGGCLCENAPGLRVDYSNMEIAAVPAPRPQIFVAAAGDWTKDTMTVEGPAVESVYRLFNATDKLRYVRFNFDHNYNQTSREAVYAWFDKWLLHKPDAPSTPEMAYTKEPDQDLRVWPDGKLPADALDETAFIQSLIKMYRNQLDSLKPANEASLKKFQQVMRPAWEHTLKVEMPERKLIAEVGEAREYSGSRATKAALGRAGRGDRIPVIMLNPTKDVHRLFVVLAHPQGKSAYYDPERGPAGLAKKLLDQGHSVLLLDTFLTGELANEPIEKARRPFANFFATYNRTDLQERVQDLITACGFAQSYSKGRQVVLCGTGQAGLWALLAAPAANAVVADADALDVENDQALMTPELFVPGIRKIGAFAGAAALAAPHPLLVYNTAGKFSTDWLSGAYSGTKLKAFRTESGSLADDAIADWIGKLKL